MHICSAIISSDEDQFAPFSIQEVSHIGAPELNSAAAGFCNVEPLFLPFLDSLHKSAFWPGDIGQLTHHGASALHVLAIHHLRLHVEDLESQSEVGLDAEESLADDNACRDVEERVRG